MVRKQPLQTQCLVSRAKCFWRTVHLTQSRNFPAHHDHVLPQPALQLASFHKGLQNDSLGVKGFECWYIMTDHFHVEKRPTPQINNKHQKFVWKGNKALYQQELYQASQYSSSPLNDLSCSCLTKTKLWMKRGLQHVSYFSPLSILFSACITGCWSGGHEAGE